MEKEINDIYTSTRIYTPILRKIIKKYGISKIFSNRSITMNPRFIILFIEMQDYELYKEISRNYPLFFLNFINVINDLTLKQYIIRITDISRYNNLSDYYIFNLWDDVYTYEPKYINLDYIETLNVSNILSKLINYDSYNVDEVVSFLLFVFYSKRDLARTVLTNENDDIDITKQDILCFLNNNKSIFSYVKDNYYPLFIASENTVKYQYKLNNIINSLNDVGYIWKSKDMIGDLRSTGVVHNITDIFFSLLYMYLKNGFVTYNIIVWTYLFGYSRVSAVLLKELFSIILDCPMQISGLVSDLLIQHNYYAVDKILAKNNKDTFIAYVQGEHNLTSTNVFYLYHDVINLIAQKPFDPISFFYCFDICLNNYKFNSNFFNSMFYTNPLSEDVMMLKVKSLSTLDSNNITIQLYNTYNLIKAKREACNFISKPEFSVIVDYEIKIFNYNDMRSYIHYIFNLPLVKYIILDILFSVYSFVPNKEKDLYSQYTNYIKKKSNLCYLYSILVTDSIKCTVDKEINKNFFLRTHFTTS